MKIHSAHFLKGVIGSEGLPQPMRPTITLFGRSNVGKSSLINCLTGTTIARANKTPGRTRELNYYLVNDRWYLVDLPGYGYAKLPPKLRDKISGYLSWFAADAAIDMRLALLIIDATVGPKASDLETFHLLTHRPLMIIINKSDKGSQSERDQVVRECQKVFQPFPILSFSSKTGRGTEALLQAIDIALTKPVDK